jgi:hypothetical protein
VTFALAREARNRLAAQAHVVGTSGLGAQVHFDVAQRFAISQLSKHHCQKLIQTGEILDLVFGPMSHDTAPKCTQRQMGHDLRKHELALVHGGPSRDNAKDHQSDARHSNRDQKKTQNFAIRSSTYNALV